MKELKLRELHFCFSCEARFGKSPNERAPRIFCVVPCLCVHLAPCKQIERVVVDLSVNGIFREQGKDWNGVFLPV
jgi:hypothetical protein